METTIIHMPATEGSEYSNCGEQTDRVSLDQAQVNCPACWTVEVRHVRVSLNLSRHDVEVATGLGSSVVWRAEQTSKRVKDEHRDKIWAYLQAVNEQGPVVKTKKTKKVTAQAELDAQTQELIYHYRNSLTLAHALIQAAIERATAQKASTKALREIETELFAALTYDPTQLKETSDDTQT